MNGSIFSMSKIANKKNESELKSFANMFAKRIAQNSGQKPCYTCECEGHNSGSAFFSCSSASCDHETNSEYVKYLENHYRALSYLPL